MLGVYYAFSEGLPEIPRVAAWAPPLLTEVYADDQVLAGEFYDERRKVVPYERIPKRLVQAFIASEDASFFDHPGIDAFGTLRAVDQDPGQEVHRRRQRAGRLDPHPADREGAPHLLRGLRQGDEAERRGRG